MTTTEYINGNCSVTIGSDGSKVREWEGVAAPLFPESIDLKITDYCDAGCAYCHEQSTRRGKHGDVADILAAIDGLPPGVEIAIGGGDPLSHPNLDRILEHMAACGLVANVTVNAVHVGPARDRLHALRNRGLIHGLGVSYRPDYMEDIRAVVDSNSVIHVIAGVHRTQDVLRLPTDWKMLVLGYKQHGFGVRYYTSRPVANDLNEWRYWIGTMMRRFHCSFDNLGLAQLDIKAKLLHETWARAYMGDDGQFTMYVDAVKREYAVSSTSPKFRIDGMGIREMFARVREN